MERVKRAAVIVMLLLAAALVPGCVPKDLRVSAVTPRYVTLSWELGGLPGDRHGFRVERRRQDETRWSSAGTVAGKGFRDWGVRAGGTYVYRVVDVPPPGTAPTASNEVTVTVPRRADLNSLSSADRRRLATLILAYVDDRVVASHAQVVHNGPEIFTMHREMIVGLEAYLSTHGGAKFVPLPMWDPATPIPPEFNVVKARDDGTPRQGLGELAPRSPRPDWLMKDEIRKIPTVEMLADRVIPWHNQVHLNVAGIMINLPAVPAAPIFWCFHATVDDLYAEWLDGQSGSGVAPGGPGHNH